MFCSKTESKVIGPRETKEEVKVWITLPTSLGFYYRAHDDTGGLDCQSLYLTFKKQLFILFEICFKKDVLVKQYKTFKPKYLR